MATSAFLWNRFAKGYAKGPVGDPAAYQRKLDVTRTYFTPESEVMEFGCGPGTTSVSHAPFVRRIRAYDISEKMLEIARSRAAEAGVDNVTFERADIIELDLPEARLDVVMGHSILHLLRPKARKAVLAKALRLLKPGGGRVRLKHRLRCGGQGRARTHTAAGRAFTAADAAGSEPFAG